MSPSVIRERLVIFGALTAALACGGDSTGPTTPPSPGAPPAISVTVLGAASANVPFQTRLRITVGGDSLSQVIAYFEGHTDTLTEVNLGIFDHVDSVHAVGPHAARLILQSASGRADTAEAILTGLNPLPVLSTRTLSLDSTETTDSVLLTLQASDNRGGVSLVSVWNGVVDSAYSAARTLTRTRWLRRPTAGVQVVSVRIRDADGGSVADSAPVRFFVIGPSAELKVPVRADTAPLIVQAAVILSRATLAYDSVRVTLSNGTTKLFTGLARADTVQVQDTLSEVGVTQVTARWYHPSASGELRDSVEVLLAPNQPPVGTFDALVDTVLEVTPATFRLAFTDDRGVRLVRLFRRAGGSRDLLQVVPLGDALSDTIIVSRVLTPRTSDTVEVELEDRDGATVLLRAAPVYTDGRPRVRSATFSPKRSLYRLGVPLHLTLEVDDEGSLSCSATSSLGATVSGGRTLPVPVRNPTAVEDSLRVTAEVVCTDDRGQTGALSSDTATVLHADVGRIVLIDVTTLSRIDQTLVVNGESLASIGQEVGLGFRGVSSISVKDVDSKWIVLVKGGSIVQYDAAGVVRTSFADGDVDTLFLIPNTAEGVRAAKDASLLMANDTAGRRFTRFLENLDVAAESGIQVATDYYDYLHWSPHRADTAQIAALRAAHEGLMTQVHHLLPSSRRVNFVQVDSGTQATINFAFENYFGGINGNSGDVTLFQFWRGVHSIDTTGYFPCLDQIMALGAHWRGVYFQDGSGPFDNPTVELFVKGKGAESRQFLQNYFSLESCTLTPLGQAVFVMQALYGNRAVDLP